MMWERLAVLTADNGECVYCPFASETMDHVVPFALGGEDELVNLVPACNSCNLLKADSSPPEFFVRDRMKTCFKTEDGLIGTALPLDEMGERFESASLEVHNLLNHLQRVRAEINAPGRLAWFRHRFEGHGRAAADAALRMREQVWPEVARAKGWRYPTPTVERMRATAEAERMARCDAHRDPSR
ncbi:HNH endonuclease [Streptomyces sp. 796.1]|uniref:HNH endonuclease n=1 Tax=Streptomyces sp. 796.1 TaxID=3163029 RepID=UPI0039C91C75